MPKQLMSLETIVQSMVDLFRRQAPSIEARRKMLSLIDEFNATYSIVFVQQQNELEHKIQYVLEFMKHRGIVLEDNKLTFPDGDYWELKDV